MGWKEVPRVNGTHPVVYSALGDQGPAAKPVTPADFAETC